jgi:hypothetical protein
MTQQRDIERLLDHWFSNGPDQASDRVVDTVTDRIERQHQRPAWRLHWRPTTVNAYAKIAVAAAAVLLVAVVGYNLLPRGSTSVSGQAPTASPSPTPSPTPAPTTSPSPTPAPTVSSSSTRPIGTYGGTVTYQSDGAPATTEVEAVADGARASGTAVSTGNGHTHSVRLECAVRKGDTWAVVGRVEHTTVPGESVGFWSAVIVRDGSPQQIAIWLSADAPAGTDCAGFLALHDFAELGPENFSPVVAGRLAPPPDRAP